MRRARMSPKAILETLVMVVREEFDREVRKVVAVCRKLVLRRIGLALKFRAVQVLNYRVSEKIVAPPTVHDDECEMLGRLTKEWEKGCRIRAL